MIIFKMVFDLLKSTKNRQSEVSKMNGLVTIKEIKSY